MTLQAIFFKRAVHHGLNLGFRGLGFRVRILEWYCNKFARKSGKSFLAPGSRCHRPRLQKSLATQGLHGGSFPRKGTQYTPLHNIVLIIGTPREVPLTLGTPWRVKTHPSVPNSVPLSVFCLGAILMGRGGGVGGKRVM